MENYFPAAKTALTWIFSPQIDPSQDPPNDEKNPVGKMSSAGTIEVSGTVLKTTLIG